MRYKYNKMTNTQKNINIDELTQEEFDEYKNDLNERMSMELKFIEFYKQKYHNQLHDMIITWENTQQAEEFVEFSTSILDVIQQLQKGVKDYVEFIFDYSDRIKEGKYVDEMETYYNLMKHLDNINHHDHINAQIHVAQIAILNTNKHWYNRFWTKIFDKPLTYNKFNILLEYYISVDDNILVSDFIQSAQFICYGEMVFESIGHKENETIGDLRGMEINTME